MDLDVRNQPRRLVRVIVVIAAVTSLGVTMCVRYEPPPEPELRMVTYPDAKPPPPRRPQFDTRFSSSKSPGDLMR